MYWTRVSECMPPFNTEILLENSMKPIDYTRHIFQWTRAIVYRASDIDPEYRKDVIKVMEYDKECNVYRAKDLRRDQNIRDDVYWIQITPPKEYQ